MSFDPLDATLPPALQEVVTYQKPAPEQEPKGETIMPEAITANANSALTPEQVRAIASEAVKQADAEKAVAAQLQKLTDEGARFKADLDKEIKAGVEKAGELATASDKIAKLEADLATANQKAVESDKTSKALAAELNKIKAERVIASRTKTLTDAGLATKDRVEKFTALAQDGTLKVGDGDFDSAVAELKVVFEAGKASVPPAPAPVSPPPSVTPAPAAANPEKKPEAKSPEQATASTKTPASPAAPDLSTIDAQTQAIASLAASANTPATDTGRSRFAKAFGAGL
jgi:hypothetical protein